MKRHTLLLNAIIRLMREEPDAAPLASSEIIEQLAARGLYRFRGRRRSSALEDVTDCLFDGFVFRAEGGGKFRLANAFRYK